MQNTLEKILKWQAKKALKKSGAKVVVVSGSVGKTSTTQAIATVLSESFNTIKTLKNYNSNLGVPCSIFEQNFPQKLKNPFAWVYIIAKNQLKILRKINVEVYVLELGTDKPGDLMEFSWLKPDIGVVTAVAPEHMEFFLSLDGVAKEELSIAQFCDITVINKRMINDVYLQYASTDDLYNYDRDDISHLGLSKSDLKIIGDHSLDAVAAGVAVGKALKMIDSDLSAGAKKIVPQQGRMNKLKGVSNTTIIDDTYNSSPEAAVAALDYLYSVDAPQKIALLGNMNELGLTSADEHSKLGEYCDPNKLDLIVTLGEDANNYLASAAKKKGCKVVTTISPYEAAKVILQNLKPDAVILCKGSQNKVFAEEAVKILLVNTEDENKLVRQGAFWTKKKRESFKELA